MSRQFRVRFPSGTGKKQTLLRENGNETSAKVIETTMAEGRGDKYRKNHRFGEVAGGAAAECAAVCCCCPCTLIHLLVLTIFKVPICLCRKAHKRHRITKKKKKKKKKLALLGPIAGTESELEKLEREVRAAVEKQNEGGDRDHDDDGETDAVDLEKEVWDQFYRTGFWRSPSQRSTK